MKIRHIIVAAVMLGLLSACSYPKSDLTSPCVGAEGSPCVRHNVNGWWLNSERS